MPLTITKTIVILFSIVGVVAIVMLLPKHSSDTLSSDLKQTTTATQSVMAYIDPVTGELTSTPPTASASSPPAIPSLTTQSDNVFEETIGADGSISIDTSHLRSPLVATINCAGNLNVEHGKPSVAACKEEK